MDRGKNSRRSAIRRHCIGVVSLLVLAQGHFLLYAPLLGCSFEGPQGVAVEDDKDDPNFHACNCRCTGDPLQSRTLRIGAAADDAEQTPATGAIDTEPGDLDLGVDRVGLRFVNVAVPQGAIIVSARLQLTADQSFNDNGAANTTLAIVGEDADNAAPFTTTPFNLSSRSATLAAVGWNPPPWAINQSGPAQRSPELKTIIQEIVDRPGWQSGNALALQISGVGRREAETYNESPARAAVLQIEFAPATTQDLNVCMPQTLNPNVGENPIPSDTDLQLDCEHRVEETLEGMASACNYPSACTCAAVAGARGFNAACNAPCAEVPLSADCSNFDPTGGTTTATNAPGDQPVCVAASDPNSSGPHPMARHIFGMDSICEVDGEATLEIGDEQKVTDTFGVLRLSGQPCPGAQCAVGIAYDLDLDPITFEVRFASDPVFVDLSSTGASIPGAVQIGPAGIGAVAAQATETSVRGRRSSNSKAFVLTNGEAVALAVDWDGHACLLAGSLATTVDTENPDSDAGEGMTASVHVTGEIVNEPPSADPGDDLTLECTSSDGAVVTLDGSDSTDPENNIVSYQWFADSRAGDLLGSDVTVDVPQALGGTSTYVLRVLDAFGQGSEAPVDVNIEDTTAPAIDCNAPPTIRPPDTPLSFTATAVDTCDDQVVPEITAFRCFKLAGNGKVIDTTHSCGVTIDGNVISIPHSRGVGTHFVWTVEAEDESGNFSEVECEVEVVNGSGKK